jgi:ribosome-associated protein
MRDVVSYTDWFVIATARNTRHAQSLSEELRTRLRDEDGLRPTRVEGEREGTWILLDYLDVVVHLFTPDARTYYRLDQLWGQVPVLEFAS